MNYENTGRELVRCAIFLQMQRYKDAVAVLVLLETYLSSTNLKREYLQTHIYLAACYQAQGQTNNYLHSLEVISSFTTQEAYDAFLLWEFHWLSALREAILQQPGTAPLKIWFSQQNGQEEQKPKEPSIEVESVPLRLHIFALGEPKVEREGTLITRWRMTRTLELFFLLLDRGKPLRKEQIILALWPMRIKKLIRRCVRPSTICARPLGMLVWFPLADTIR